MKIITSNDNNLIKKFRSLSVKKYREQFGLCLLEGEKVVFEALKLQGVVENLIVPQSSKETYADIIKSYDNVTIVVSDDVYKTLAFAETPQSIMATIKINQSKPINIKENIVVLDRLQDPGNLGTIIRSGVASGHLEFILVDSVDPYNDKTIRSASGTIFYPNFTKMKMGEFIEFASKNKLNLVVADMGGVNIYSNDCKVSNPYTLIIGNEGQGVSKDILSLPHNTVAIPMTSKVESLNAGVSASILMFELNNKNIKG